MMCRSTHPARIDKGANLVQTILFRVETGYGVEVRSVHKTATSVVRPAMIATAQHAAAADGARGDGVGAVAANVVECT